jgi:hypothetical protein
MMEEEKAEYEPNPEARKHHLETFPHLMAEFCGFVESITHPCAKIENGNLVITGETRTRNKYHEGYDRIFGKKP